MTNSLPTPGPSRMREGRKQPRWITPFLRSLERTGSVEEAARDAGIDKSTAYHRRKTHPDFAEEWEGALRRRSGRAEEVVQERVGFWDRVKGKVSAKMLLETSPGCAAAPPPPSVVPLPTSSARREELLASTSLGGQVKRVGAGRWNGAAEERFFGELAATANVKRAAEAAGVSTNAVYQRRLKRPDFRAKWDAVLETGRSAIEMHLIETAKKSFDPDDLDVGDAQPKVSVAEAIRIVQLHGSKTQRLEVEEVEPPEEEIEAVRKRILDKLQKLRKRMMPEMLANGWSYDEEHKLMVPPGWTRTPGPRFMDTAD
ncbi:MAG: hypothetical protein ACTHN4_03765 [Sphingomicrobium sp.]